MDKKPRTKRKQKPLQVELTYRPVELDQSTQQSLDRAFDVLFGEVLKRRQSSAKECPQNVIDS